MKRGIRHDIELSESEMLFVHRLLIAIEHAPESQLTAEMILSAYRRLYPMSAPRRVLRYIIPRATRFTEENLVEVLMYLVERRLLRRDVTRYIRGPLDVDTPVYSLTASGRQFLHDTKSR